MRYACTLSIQGDAMELARVFEPEKTGFRGGRASLCMKRVKDGIRFNIRARDAVSLRAALNSVLKLLCVWETLNKAIA